MNIRDPMEFLQLLFSPDLAPAQLQDMALTLAAKAAPPQIGVPGGGLSLTPGTPPIPQVANPPGFATNPNIPPDTGTPTVRVPGAGTETDWGKIAALTAQQQAQYAKMLEQAPPHFIGNPAPPGMRGLMGNMQMLQTPAMPYPMSLADLLSGRR